MARPPDVPRGLVGLPDAVAGLVAVAALLSTEDRQLLIRALSEQLLAEMTGGLLAVRRQDTGQTGVLPPPGPPVQARQRSTRSRRRPDETEDDPEIRTDRSDLTDPAPPVDALPPAACSRCGRLCPCGDVPPTWTTLETRPQGELEKDDVRDLLREMQPPVDPPGTRRTRRLTEEERAALGHQVRASSWGGSTY